LPHSWQNLHSPRGCHRQVVDLMRACLVIGLPLGSIHLVATTLAMGKFRRFQATVTSVILLALLYMAGCSRLVSFGGSAAGNQPEERKLPFHSDTSSDAANASRQRAQTVAALADQKIPGNLPFASPASRNLPSGTLLTIRLQDLLSTAKIDSSGVFTAAVDDPVVIDGTLLIPRGTPVHGRVEAAQASDVKRDTGFMRLTLESITADGKELPLHTSSLFARGSAPANRTYRPTGDNSSAQYSNKTANIVRLPKGRRLTFRLASSLDLPITTPTTVKNHLPTAQ
jgi:hypothetical protein